MLALGIYSLMKCINLRLNYSIYQERDRRLRIFEANGKRDEAGGGEPLLVT